jgi:branched-chain amino acid aminotransferase
MKRLYASARALGIRLEASHPPHVLARGAAALLRRNRLADAMLRLSFTRGESRRWGLSSGGVPGRPFVTMFAAPFKGYPTRLYERGVAMVTSPLRHVPPESLPSGVKSLNYLGGVLAADGARRRRAAEALLLDMHGRVAEGTRSSVFWVRRAEVFTPALNLGILPGITRARALDLLGRMGFIARETAAPRRALDSADEIFYTNTSSWAMPVTRLDGKRVGNGRPGKVSRLLLSAFRVYYAELH